MRLFYKIFILGIVIISFLLLTWYILFPVSVRDAYLDNQGHFYFTLINNRYEALDLTYKWHLDDPKAGKPVYRGKGEIKLPARSGFKVMETFIPINDYDQRFFIMNIEVFKGNTTVGSYNEQKSPYDWDYSTPPPSYKYI